MPKTPLNPLKVFLTQERTGRIDGIEYYVYALFYEKKDIQHNLAVAKIFEDDEIIYQFSYPVSSVILKKIIELVESRKF